MEKKDWLSDEDYHFIFSRVPRLCVDIVIQNESGVILSRRDIEPYKGDWHIPGGRVFHGEALESAAKRIAEKETGLEVKIEKLIGTIEYLDKKAMKHLHNVSIVYLAKPAGGILKNDFQSTQVKYHATFPEPICTLHREFLRMHEFL